MSLRTIASVVLVLVASTAVFAQEDTRKLWKHSQGSFKHFGGKEWVETHDSGAEFDWVEKERTKQAIKLYDPKRKVSISLGAASAVVTSGTNKATYKGAWAELPVPAEKNAKAAPAKVEKEEKLPPLTEAEGKTLEWIDLITLRPQLGGERSGTRRWMRPPTLSIMKASTDQAMPIVEAVKDLNETLAKTPIKGIKMVEPDTATADILVYLAPQEQLPKIAKGHNLELNNEHAIYSYGQQDPKFEMKRGFVFAASDKLSGDALRKSATWSLLGTLGFQQTSKLIAESIFAGNPDGMSELDRKLVVFFYNHVPPMTDDREMRKLFQTHWPK